MNLGIPQLLQYAEKSSVTKRPAKACMDGILHSSKQDVGI
jgi:hypothetical protein